MKAAARELLLDSLFGPAVSGMFDLTGSDRARLGILRRIRRRGFECHAAYGIPRYGIALARRAAITTVYRVHAER